MKQLEINFQKQLKHYMLDMKVSMNGGCLGILGASGCGKSMTLKAVAGIVRPDHGRIAMEKTVFYDSEKKIDLSPQKRKVGYLFQNYALFPNMTVEDNIMAGIQGKKAEKKQKAAELMEQFQLRGLEKQYPTRLSGGQQQRTALARILASEPDILLLDEPFSAMDSYLKEELQLEMQRRIRNFAGCTILVSHDRDEIYRLCTDTMIMEKGKNVITDNTKALFENPRKVAAARLTGCKNISQIEKRGQFQVYAKDWGISLWTAEPVSEKTAYIGVRAHDILPAAGKSGEGGAEGENQVNRFPVLPVEQSETPFEQTIIFKADQQAEKGLWMKSERGGCRIPEAVTIAPERLLLLEEN